MILDVVEPKRSVCLYLLSALHTTPLCLQSYILCKADLGCSRTLEVILDVPVLKFPPLLQTKQGNQIGSLVPSSQLQIAKVASLISQCSDGQQILNEAESNHKESQIDCRRIEEQTEYWRDSLEGIHYYPRTATSPLLSLLLSHNLDERDSWPLRD